MREWDEEISQLLAKLNLEPAREAAIVREISQHLDDCYQEWLASGATPAEAERRALAELGASDLLQRELRRVNVDETPRLRGGGGLHTRARDQREHHDLLDHQRLLLQAVAGEGPGPACTGAAKERRLEDAARPLLARLSRLS